MWRVFVIGLTLVVGSLALDRSSAREKLVDYRVRSQNLHVDHLEDVLHKLENKFNGLSRPLNEWDVNMLKARVRRAEGRKCEDREVSCGGDHPECISNLFVCDGHVDCHNGNDESEEVCNSEVAHVGSTYQGIMHWTSCVTSKDHEMIVTITAVHHPSYFTTRTHVRATVTSDSEVLGDPERLHFYTMKGYYVFGSRQLVLMPDESADSHAHHDLGMICSFHFGDLKYTDCVVKKAGSLTDCGFFRAIKS